MIRCICTVNGCYFTHCIFNLLQLIKKSTIKSVIGSIHKLRHKIATYLHFKYRKRIIFLFFLSCVINAMQFYKWQSITIHFWKRVWKALTKNMKNIRGRWWDKRDVKSKTDLTHVSFLRKASPGCRTPNSEGESVFKPQGRVFTENWLWALCFYTLVKINKKNCKIPL